MCKSGRFFYGNNEHQFGDLRLPEGEGPFPVAIIIHGGFWRSNRGLELMDRFAIDLTMRGIATWNIEYRRVGHQGGGWPGTFNDVSQAADYLHTLADSNNLDLSRVVPIGHSAGGHLGLLLAARKATNSNGINQQPLSMKGVISLAGVCDLALMWEVHHIHEMSVKQKSNPVYDFLGGSPDRLPQHYKEASPIELLPLGVPQVLIHGTLDINVPIGIGYSYKNAADKTNDDVRLVEIPTAEHFKLIDPDSDAWPIIVENLMNLLR